MERYVCIHGHFYQPPRENPTLEAVELQDSAYPYHDWNERITAECYAPNAASRILDSAGRLERIVNNYSQISFNFGPTLLAWMEQYAPRTYQAVLAADRESQANFGGHGSALAQAYNHMILPLANRRDKVTQVAWGIRDFERRFGRFPEGMWLPETAADRETLQVLAEAGIRFTVLSPYQARRFRLLGKRGWRDASGGRIDPSTAYLCRLANGRSITLFFYDGPISRGVAFEGLLTRGENLAGRLLSAFNDQRPWPQLVHIATDGESYGHHHVHGDMALAYALHTLRSRPEARLTNYGEFLELHPPLHEADIFENSSWSCVHGVERWQSDCGCSSGGRPQWNQGWRAPLRRALDWLRDRLAGLYGATGRDLLEDPWAARDAYLDVMLDRAPENVDTFLAAHAPRPLDDAEKRRALELLEMQRHALLMFTSCGWFFDELSGIETVQVMRYAGRALQLARHFSSEDLEGEFLDLLGEAKSNLAQFGDGRNIYEKLVKPSLVDLPKVGSHYAVSSLFADYEERSRIYCYRVLREEEKILQAGKTRLALGRITISSEITREEARVVFGVVHLGDHNLSGGTRAWSNEADDRRLLEGLAEVFERGDVPELIRAVDRAFGPGASSLRLLFRDEQRRILRRILDSTLTEAEALYRRFYEEHASLMRFVAGLELPMPRRFKLAAELILNIDLRRAFEAAAPDAERIERLLEEARSAGVELDRASEEFALRRTLDRLAEEFGAEPDNLERLRTLAQTAGLAAGLPFEVNLWHPQNVYFQVLESALPRYAARQAAGEEEAGEWLSTFRALGEKLHVRVPDGEGGEQA